MSQEREGISWVTMINHQLDGAVQDATEDAFNLVWSMRGWELAPDDIREQQEAAAAAEVEPEAKDEADDTEASDTPAKRGRPKTSPEES